MEVLIPGNWVRSLRYGTSLKWACTELQMRAASCWTIRTEIGSLVHVQKLLPLQGFWMKTPGLQTRR